MSVSYASLLRPWKSLPRIMAFYAAAGFAATSAVILVNGFVAQPNRTNQLLQYQDVAPPPQQATPIEASPDVVAEVTGLGHVAQSSPALLFAAVPLEIGTSTLETAPSANPSSKLVAAASMMGSWTTLAQRDASFEGWDPVPDGFFAAGGAALASFDNRYAKFPNGVDLDRLYPPGLLVMPADVPRLAGALLSANAGNTKAGVFVTSSDPSFMKDLRRRLRDK